MDEAVTAADISSSVDAVVTMLARAPKTKARWDGRAGALRWSCRRTLAHVVDCLNWYAANLARRSTSDVASADVAPTASPAMLVDALRSAGAVLAAAVASADPADRGWHPFGIADRSGFAAMGCDEVLVHGFDLAAGLGRAGTAIRYDPPGDVARRVAERLFPWSPTEADPWESLLWANGRVDLGDRPRERRWLWHCAPLDQWDGRTRRMRSGRPAVT